MCVCVCVCVEEYFIPPNVLHIIFTQFNMMFCFYYSEGKGRENNVKLTMNN